MHDKEFVVINNETNNIIKIGSKEECHEEAKRVTKNTSIDCTVYQLSFVEDPRNKNKTVYTFTIKNGEIVSVDKSAAYPEDFDSIFKNMYGELYCVRVLATSEDEAYSRANEIISQNVAVS